jgi:hypothetical protein
MSDGTNAIELYQDEVRFQRALAVIKHQVEHGSKTRKACEACNVPVSTFYQWLEDGVLTEYLTDARRVRAELTSAVANEAAPDVLRYMVALATGKTQVRGANPVAAAKLVLEIAGGQHDTYAAESGKTTTNIFLPEMVTLNVMAAGRGEQPEAPQEVLEAEYEEVK